MIGIISALLSAVASAFSIILVRRNSVRSNSFSISFIITSVGILVLWPLAFVMLSEERVNSSSFLLFALSGALSPGIVRLFYYRGLRKLGASVNSSVFSIYPLYSALLGIMLLGETLSGMNWVGIIFIAFGVTFIQLGNWSGDGGGRAGAKSLIFPVLGGVTIAVGNVIGKYALNISDAPVLGIAVAYTFSLLPFMVILLFSSPTRRELRLKRDIRFFWGAGIGQAVCWVLTFTALHFEQVSVVNPLVSTEPLFVIFFAYFLLREIEHVSKKVIAGVVLTVVGVVLGTL